MNREILSIKRKALRINLDAAIYGTFAEIGAGQEVARTFFQVGGASGTIAKTMSAYDMSYSDAIYGEEESGRYVSDSRLQKMLDHEVHLLNTRLTDDKYENKRFFAFADTCSVINFKKTNDPHCWMGLRFQTDPNGEYNDVIVHARLKDSDAILQQRVIGGLGVNLIYACFNLLGDMNSFVDSLLDNLSIEQLEIDLLKVKGPSFKIDNRLLALKLVKKGLTDATIFGCDKEVIQPKDYLYKKNVLCLRSRFRPFTLLSENMQRSGEQTFKQHLKEDKTFVELSELTLNNLLGDMDDDPTDFLDRADLLCSLGHTVLISNCDKHDKLVNFFNRCNVKEIGLIVGVMNLEDLFNKSKYKNAPSELLGYFGGIFTGNTMMIAHPYFSKEKKEVIEADKMVIDPTLDHIYQHLLKNNLVVNSTPYDRELLHIFSEKIFDLMHEQKPEWKNYVPVKVASLIEEKHLFGYQAT